MAPTTDTITAVTSAAVSSSTACTRRTPMPSAAAASAPKVKASSARACSRQTTSPSVATTVVMGTSGQRTPLRLPSSQNMMPRACSALPDLVMISEVSALKSCDPAMPARMICPLLRSPPPPAAWASSATSAKAVTAPAKAPTVIDTMPPPTPATATSTAPVEAPAEMPSR